MREAYKGDGDWVSNGNLVIQDGKVGVLTAKSNEYGEVTRTFESTLKHDKMLPRIKSMIEVRTAMKKLIAGQIEGSKELELMALRTELQKAYDNFVGKYGRLQDKDNSFILDDIDGYTIQALERWKNGDNEGLEPLLKKLNQTFDRYVGMYGNLHKNTQLAWLRNDVDYPSILALESFEERPNAEGERIRTYGKTDIFSQRVVEMLVRMRLILDLWTEYIVNDSLNDLIELFSSHDRAFALNNITAKEIGDNMCDKI